MVKKIVSLILALSLLFSHCFAQQSGLNNDKSYDSPVFATLGNQQLLEYVEETVYRELASELDPEIYTIQAVNAKYVSKEYLQELEYNSRSNIFFGYTLEELDDLFEGEKYFFTLDDEGNTVVKRFERQDDSFSRILKNVAIGTGVILVCVIATVATGGVGTLVGSIIAWSANGAIIGSTGAGLVSGAVAAYMTGTETGDYQQALEAFALAGSEGYKWGAIAGAFLGGAGKGLSLLTDLNITTALSVARKVINNGYKPLEGYSSKAFGNYEGLLPAGLTYMEHDVFPFVSNATRGVLRLVFGSDGSVWYTADHYRSFIKLF